MNKPQVPALQRRSWGLTCLSRLISVIQAVVKTVKHTCTKMTVFGKWMTNKQKIKTSHSSALILTTTSLARARRLIMCGFHPMISETSETSAINIVKEPHLHYAFQPRTGQGALQCFTFTHAHTWGHETTGTGLLIRRSPVSDTIPTMATNFTTLDTPVYKYVLCFIKWQ